MVTYGFEDVTVSFQHNGVGAASSIGAGIGSISISMTTDRTTHNVAADGTIMVSKVAGKNGNMALEIQQNSELHKWLVKWNNYIEISNSSEWAGMTITIKSSNLGDSTICTGVSPQKLPDRPYGAQGAMVTWQLMAAKITQS